MSSSYELTFEDHPAKQVHPFTGEQILVDGKPVPIFDDQFCVKLDGRIIAYVLPNKAVSFIVPKKTLGPIAEEAIKLAEENVGTSDTSPGFVTENIETDEDE